MYKWQVSELEMEEYGFETAERAYINAKQYFESEGFEVGNFDGEGCTLYDATQGFEIFDGYCYIEEEE